MLGARTCYIALVGGLYCSILHQDRPSRSKHPPRRLGLPASAGVTQRIRRQSRIGRMHQLVNELPRRRGQIVLLHSIGSYSFRRVRRTAKLGTVGVHILLDHTHGGVHRRCGTVVGCRDG